MFQNWSTKDEIETSIRTFQRVRDEIENMSLSKIEWRNDENGRENLQSETINECVIRGAISNLVTYVLKKFTPSILTITVVLLIREP